MSKNTPPQLIEENSRLRTELAQLKEQLRRKEAVPQWEIQNRQETETLEAIVALTHHTVFIIDRSGIFRYVNGGLNTFLGYEPNAIIGDPFIQYAPVSERVRYQRAFADIFEKEEIVKFETAVLNAQGNAIPVEVNGRLITYENETAVLGTVRDILRRKSVEASLEASQQMLRLVLDTIPVRVFWKDKNLAYLGCNLPFAQDAGVDSPSKMLGKNDHDFPWHEQADLYQADDQYVIESGEAKTAYEEPQTTPDGNIIWLRTSKIPLRDTNGNIIGVLGTYEDITDYVLANQTIRENEERYRNLIEHSTDAIYLVYQGKFEIINSRFSQLFGYSLEEINQLDSEFLQHITPDHQLLIEQKDSGGIYKSLQDYPFTAVSKDGTKVEVEASTSQFEYKDGLAIQGIIRDVSERKQLELQLQQIQKMDAIGRLAGGVAHDFNNLLTVISGYTDLLLIDATLSAKQHSRIKQVQQAGQKAESLTRQLLAFSRKQLVQPQEVDLNQIVRSSIKLFSRLIGEDIEISLHLDESLVPIWADAHQIDQILINLLINARDAINENKNAQANRKIIIETGLVILDDAYIKTHLDSSPGANVLLAVSDSGVGMDQPTVEQIFEPFFTTKEVGKGTGLGLATVYGIVKQNKANIVVYSEPGKGSTFKIYWPLSEEARTRTFIKGKIQKALPGSETILLVEDEDSVRQFTELALMSLGYRLLTASNAAEAWQIFLDEQANIDLVITDMVMPGSTGWQLAQKLWGERRDLPILFVSGYTDEHISKNGFIEEDVLFLQKPYSVSQLSIMIRQLLTVAD